MTGEVWHVAASGLAFIACSVTSVLVHVLTSRLVSVEEKAHDAAERVAYIEGKLGIEH